MGIFPKAKKIVIAVAKDKDGNVVEETYSQMRCPKCKKIFPFNKYFCWSCKEVLQVEMVIEAKESIQQKEE